jgi:putative toxin-antitoxin system antitoxin component (TIGR02293 family)
MIAEVKTFKPSNNKTTGIWSEVGLPSRGQALHVAVAEGIATAVYASLAKAMSSDTQELSKLLFISATTAHRREKVGRFNTSESDKIVRATKVFVSSVGLFEGDRKSANKWMRTPVKGLGGKAPIEMLGTSVESEAVLDLIGRLEHGVFA